MANIPKIRGLDSTFQFLLQPYHFISRQVRRHSSKKLEGRLMLQRTIFLQGEENARLFYDSNRFCRKDAMPGMVLNTLLGQDGVQTLDDEQHRHRKLMFMSLMTNNNIRQLTEITHKNLLTYADKWRSMEQIILYDEIREILTRSVCAWAGVPLVESEVKRRTQQLTALYDSAGAKNHRHLWSRIARQLSDRWAKAFIEKIRSTPGNVPQNSPAQIIALHRNMKGELLDSKIAAVELINILRPTVAVAVYITFVAHALHQHPIYRAKIMTDNEGIFAECFVQEVRRMYPFFPAVAARVRKDFVHNGCQFSEGRRAILDLYGTNLDEESWDDPEIFKPERFLNWEENLFSFIPQGGGDSYVTHRCPGEDITVAIMKTAAEFLVRDVEYDVPNQDMSIDEARLPALPRSRFIMTNVRITGSETI